MNDCFENALFLYVKWTLYSANINEVVFNRNDNGEKCKDIYNLTAVFSLW